MQNVEPHTQPKATKTPALILASKSKARQDMLHSAGLDFTCQPADIDEEKILQKLQQKGTDLEEIASSLAKEKALKIAAQNKDALVIGSDQILTFEGQIFQKAQSAQEAIDRLKAMQNQSHDLISSLALVRGDDILLDITDKVTLTMGSFDESFWQDYAQKAGPALTSSVGGYWFEDIGSWLFTAIKGNIHTLLGMPLLPLLQYLNAQHKMKWKEGA